MQTRHSLSLWEEASSAKGGMRENACRNMSYVICHIDASLALHPGSNSVIAKTAIEKGMGLLAGGNLV